MRRTAGPRRIPQALERDRHLGREPVRDRLAAAQEKGVPRSVAARHASAPAAAEPAAAAAAAAGDDRIALHAVAVHREHVGALLIEKRIEVDRDRVVAEARPVAVDPIRPHGLRVVVLGMKRQIEIRVVIGDVDVGVLGRRRPIDRLTLHELRDARRVPPHRIVQQAVDGRGGHGPPRTHRHPSGEHTGIAGRQGGGDRGDRAGRAGAGRGRRNPGTASREPRTPRGSTGRATASERRDRGCGAEPAGGPGTTRVRSRASRRRSPGVRPAHGRNRCLRTHQANQSIRHFRQDPILQRERIIGVTIDLGRSRGPPRSRHR